MSNSLVRVATGEVVPAKSDRQLAKRAKTIYDETRLKALDAEARVALAKHIMVGLADLDTQRKTLCSPEDTVLHNILCAVEMEAIEQVQEVQRRGRAPRPVDPWNFR